MSDPPPNPWATPAATDPPAAANPWASPSSSSPTPSSSTPSATAQPSPASIAAEVAQLDTILFRFASTSDAKFESTVARVLPNLLPLLRRDEAEVRQKVIECLQHINKRINVLPDLQLPVSELVMMYVDPLYNSQPLPSSTSASSPTAPSSSSSFFFTFTLMFIEKGFTRIDKREQSILAPHLLVHSSTHPLSQQTTLLHIFLSSLPSMQYALDDEKMREKWLFAHNAGDKQLVLSFLQDFLLYIPPPSKPLTPAQPSTTPTSASPPPDAAAPTPEGLSPDAVTLITKGGKLVWSNEEVNRHKVHVLAFLSALSHSNLSEASKFNVEEDEEIFGRQSKAAVSPPLLSDNDIFPHALIATCVGSSEVNREAETLLRRMKTLQLSSPPLLNALYALFLGSMDNAKIVVSQRRAPAGINLRLKILSYFNKVSPRTLLRSTFLSQTRARISSANIAPLLCLQTAASVNASLALSLKALFDSFFGAVTNYRLRYSALFFASHFIKAATLPSLTSVGQVLINALLKLLALLQATPAPPNPFAPAPTSAALTPQQTGTLRGLVYHNLGLLSTRLPTLFTRNLKMLQLFFKALAEEKNDEVVSQVHEGLVYLRSAFVVAGEGQGEAMREMKGMLIGLCDSDEKRVRLNALTCLNRLFEFSDVQCRWQCVVCSNDPTIEMRDEANKGLVPFALKDTKANESRMRERAERDRELAREEKVDRGEVKDGSAPMDVEEKTAETDGKLSDPATARPAPANSGSIYSRMDPTVAADEPYPSFPAFMALVAQQLALDVGEGVSASSSAARLSPALQLDSVVLIHLMDFVAACYQDSAKQQKTTLPVYATSLTSASPSSLLSYQHLLESAFLSPLSDVQSSASVHLVALVESAPAFFAPLYTQRVAWLQKYLLGNSAESRVNTATLLALLVPSFAAATVASLLPQFTAILSAAPSLSSSASDSLHGATLAIGVLVADQRRRGGPVSKDEVEGVQLLVDRLDGSVVAKDASLAAAACVSVGRIGRVAKLPMAADAEPMEEEQTAPSREKKQRGEAYDRPAVVRRLLALTKGSDRKQERVTEEAVKALGSLVRGDHSRELVQPILDGLLQLVTLKHEEVQFAVGETLAIIGDVEDSTATPSATSSTPSEAAASLVGLPYLQSILSYSLEQLSKGSQVARAASCTWLLSLIKFSARLPPSTYPPLQSRLTITLTDSYQFTQEAAAKALALLYEKTDNPASKEELVNSLLKTFTSGAHKLSADTEVQLKEGEETATMKELMTVANDMGQPDLVYRFMEVASNHSAWQSKMGSAFTLSSILSSNASMKDKVVDLLPRLYLYQYDPNPKIKESMHRMWETLLDHPKQMVDQQFHPIIRHLLRSQESRQFRLRLAASLGLVDLISHRSWGEVGPYLQQLWANLFRLLDDVNGETRKAATTLANTLSQLSCRLADPKYSSQKAEVKQCLDILLPILLKEGITARPKEVQSVSIKTLLRVIQHGGVFLRPHLADLLGTLLEGMSSQESSSLQHLQFHAKALQMSDEDLELARLSVAKNTPLADAVASCLQVVDAESLPSVISRLSEVLQQGIGLPTLTATAKFIISLVNSPVGNEMKEQAIGPLMSSLVQGLNDQSTSVRRVFAAALGYLCRVSKRKRVGRVIEGLLSQYTSDDSQPPKRLSCGLAVQQIVDRASESTREEFFPVIAPYAFLASHDPEEDVKKLWSAVWEEMVPSTDSGAVTYQAEIVALCLTTFESPSWTMRQTTYTALTTLVKASKGQFQPHVASFVPLVVKAMPGRIWAGKEKLFGLAVALCAEVKDDKKSRVTEEEVKELLRVVVDETKRQKTNHKRDAIAAVGEIVAANDGLDATDDMRPTLDAIFTQATSVTGSTSSRDSANPNRAIGSDADVHERMKTAKDDQQYFVVAYTALGRLFPAASLADSQRSHIDWYVKSLTRALRSGLDWPVRVEALKALKGIITRAAPGVLTRDLVAEAVDALVSSSRDGKQSGVRANAMEALLALLQRDDDKDVQQWMQEDSVNSQLKTMLRERRDDPVAEVLTLSDSITAKMAANKARG